MKIMFIENSTFTITRFRLPFLRELISQGHSVTAICGDNEYSKALSSEGINIISTDLLNNRSISVLKDFRFYSFLKFHMLAIKPDIVFTYQLKPNIYGCLSAKRAKVEKIIATVEGIGDPFIKNGVKWSFVRLAVSLLLKISFCKIARVVFLNSDNRLLYLKRHICKKVQATVVNGVGVDSNKFEFYPISNFSKIVMVSRLLKTKGIIEYCEAARKVFELRPDLGLTFDLFGKESDITINEISQYIESGVVNYRGFSNDMVNVYKDSGMVVLPSYGEGVPMSLMEAMSVGRPVIATNVSGCREVVNNGWNGFLVPPKDSNSLADAIISLASSRETMVAFGRNSRELVETKFSFEIIQKELIRLINE